MQTYIGTKLVRMKPMSRQEYNDLRGWSIPFDENGADEGYLVEYPDGGKANVAGYEHYVSWSPKAVAEAAYRSVDGMTFGLATEMLKKGWRVARDGWNGKGMFVYLVPASSYPAQTGAAKAFFGEGSMVPYNAYFALKGADSAISTWVPSASDALAEDWHVVR